MSHDVCCYCECFTEDGTCPGDNRCYDPLKGEYYSFKSGKPLTNKGVSLMLKDRQERREGSK